MSENETNKFKKQKTQKSINRSIEKDNAEIKYYEKKLGIKLKTSKEFYKDGLDDLIDFCDSKGRKLMQFELNDEQPEEVRQSDFQPVSKKFKKKTKIVSRSDDELEENNYQDNTRDRPDKSIENIYQETKCSISDHKSDKTKWVSKRLLNNKRNLELDISKRKLKGFNNYRDTFDEDQSNETDEEPSDIDEPGNKIESVIKQHSKEDIYGRLLDKKGQIIKENVNKIVGIDNQMEQELTMKVRGLLNKMELKNLLFIVSELEQIFGKHSNNLVCRCLFNCIDQLIIKNQILAPQKLCTEISMLIAICHSKIGEEVSANILHHLVQILNQMFEQLENDINKFSGNKYFENLLMMICLMYGVNIIEEKLIYDILEKLVDVFNAKSIELILFCLKLVGYLLRKDNTFMMKSLILNVQQKANLFDKEKISEKRVLFILNALTNIKNNVSLKMDLSDIQNIVPINKQTIKNDLKLLFKNINISCLKGRYNEILKSNRWFVHSGELSEITMKRKIEKQKEISLPTLNEKLIKKLQLTTPFRKLIFNIIYTCDDYIECSQNIIKSTNKNHFEVVLICLHICLNEREFNPFYVYLLRYLSHIDRNYKRGVLFNVKEKIKNLSNLNEQQKLNLQNVIIHLLKMNILSLLVLDVIDFKDMAELHKNFMCNIFENIFKEELPIIDLIFKKLPKKSSLSTSIKVFINIFLPEECKTKLKGLKTEMNSNNIF